MAFDLGGYFRGEQGIFPDYGGKSTTQSVKDFTGAGPNDGWLPGDQSAVTQHIPGFQTDPSPEPEPDPTDKGNRIYIDDQGRTDKERLSEYGSNVIDFFENPIGSTFDWLSGKINKAPEPKPKPSTKRAEYSLDWYRQNLDPSNKGMVKDLQSKLGIEADGMFGPQTQAAWRNAVSQSIAYQNNLRENSKNIPLIGQQVSTALGPKEDQLKYDYNPDIQAQRMREKGPVGGFLSKGWTNLDKKLGGILPGGYKKDATSMTQEEFENYGK